MAVQSVRPRPIQSERGACRHCAPVNEHESAAHCADRSGGWRRVDDSRGRLPPRYGRSTSLKALRATLIIEVSEILRRSVELGLVDAAGIRVTAPLPDSAWRATLSAGGVEGSMNAITSPAGAISACSGTDLGQQGTFCWRSAVGVQRRVGWPGSRSSRLTTEPFGPSNARRLMLRGILRRPAIR